MRTKICASCKEEKSLDSFYSESRSYCKGCHKAKRRESYVKNDGIGQTRRQNWKRYGVTPDEHDAMLSAQGGGCAICGGLPKEGWAFSVDHDHVSGAVRKLLCTNCNCLLGNALDDPRILRDAADYLERHVATTGLSPLA